MMDKVTQPKILINSNWILSYSEECYPYYCKFNYALTCLIFVMEMNVIGKNNKVTQESTS